MKVKSYTFINSDDHNKSLSNIPEEYYIDLIMGQYNVIKNSEIRDVKIKQMLAKLQDEFKQYISDN